MENNLTNYLRLQHVSIKEEADKDEDDFPSNYFQWTPDSTNLLLKLRFDKERHSKFEDRSFQRKELWDEISTEMYRIGGHHISGDVCDLKYRNLLHTYKKNRKKELKGTGPESISWSYYEIFRQVLKDNEEKDTSQLNHTDVDGSSQVEETISNNNNKNNSIKKRKVRVIPVAMEVPDTPCIELRPLSARLSSKRILNMSQSTSPQQHSTPLGEHASKMRCVELEKRNENVSSVQENISGFELEECRVFGETVGVQLSLIKTPEIRALAELKIQEILYAAKLSKLKE